MNGLSKLVPALDVALFILSVIALVFPVCPPSSFPSSRPPRPHPILCRLLVIFVATCFGASGLLQLVYYHNSSIFAARVIELVGQSVGALFSLFIFLFHFTHWRICVTATFATIWFFFKFCLSSNQHNGLPVSSCSTAARTTPSFLPAQDNGGSLRSKMRFTPSWTALLFTPISRILHVTLVALFMAGVYFMYLCFNSGSHELVLEQFPVFI